MYMTTPKMAPYGSWKSPITPELILSGAVRPGLVTLDGEVTYWTEGRPGEGGRSVLVRRTPDGQKADMTPPPFNVRTRVHEYGGGDYTVSNGTIYFSNFADQRVYRLISGEEPYPITPAEQYRYADYVVDSHRNRLICVREDHTVEGREAVNTLVSLATDDNPDGGEVLIFGNDFYASPRLSPDGSQLAWLTWNHPNMPWDGTELWVGTFDA